MESELQQWAASNGIFVKPGEQDVELRVKSDTSQVKVSNSGKSKLWFCGFCGASCGVRGIRSHLAKPASKKGCAGVTVDALRELVCFGVSEAEQKIEELEANSKAPEPETKDRGNQWMCREAPRNDGVLCA